MTRSSGIGKKGGVAESALGSGGEAGVRGVIRNGRDGANREATERQRRAVIAYLRARFRNALCDDDVEDLTQDAWAAVLEKRERGERIGDTVALMRSIAWRGARDLLRDRRETAVDPGDRIFVGVEDRTGAHEERLDQRADLARAIAAVEQLGPEHRAAYRARFVDELSTKEACKRLGLPRSTYHHRVRRALEAVHTTLDSERFELLQVKLLGAYVAGIASLAERRRAERLIRNDPQSAAVARELRATHEATAAALTPVAVDPQVTAGVVERLGGVPGRLRDAVASVGGRGDSAADLAASPVVAGGGARGAGAVGAGALAKLAGLGAAGKAALACVGTGAAATACVAAGVIPGVGGLSQESPVREPDERTRPVADVVVEAPPVQPEPSEGSEERPGPKPDPNPDPSEETDGGGEPAPVAPSAPPVEQEFGVVSASNGGGGGGGSSSTSGGGSALQREFGGP